MTTPTESLMGLYGMNEGRDQAAISDYLKTGGQNLDPSTTAWCAAAVNAALTKSGVQGTGSNMARSFMDWGQPVDQPMPGDVAVFSRGDPNGPFGHVGLFQGIGPDGQIQVLGGNQGDSVSMARMDPTSLLGYRRAAGAAPAAPAAQPPAPGGLGDMFLPPVAAAPAAEDGRAAKAEEEKRRRTALFNVFS